MKFDVTARSFNRKTGEPSGEGRVETIDTVENSLFINTTNVLIVKEIYESFWNDINPQSEDVVFVSQVTPVK